MSKYYWNKCSNYSGTRGVIFVSIIQSRYREDDFDKRELNHSEIKKETSTKMYTPI